MTTMASSYERCHAALQRIQRLYAEQQFIYQASSRVEGLTDYEKRRLHQIHRELAIAQDERNRARCGAPPAPPDYDPLVEPPQVQHHESKGGHGLRKTNIQEVEEMRRLYNNDGLSQREVIEQFSHLKETTVRDILKNRTWYDPDYVPRQTGHPSKVRDVMKQRTRSLRHDS